MRIKMRLIVLLVVCLFMQLPLQAELNIQDVQNIQKIVELANHGDTDAQLKLSKIYFKGGISLERNEKKALKWLKKSAEKGNTEAQYILGNLYFEGKIVQKNNKIALTWLKKSANNGYIEAYNNIGIIYKNEEKRNEAIKWFVKAAEYGDPEALNNINIFYIAGHGTYIKPSATQNTTGNRSPSISSINGNVTINYESSIDEKIKKLKKANLVFSSPSTMVKNRTYILIAKLNASKDVESLLKELKNMEKSHAKVRYSTRMVAKMISENKKAFEITNITSETQAISSIDTTTWKWDVTPLESGKQYLHITLTALLDIKGKETELSLRTFDREIKVDISITKEVMYFLKDSWKWILGSLMFPLIAWYWKIRHPQKES